MKPILFMLFVLSVPIALLIYEKRRSGRTGRDRVEIEEISVAIPLNPKKALALYKRGVIIMDRSDANPLGGLVKGEKGLRSQTMRSIAQGICGVDDLLTVARANLADIDAVPGSLPRERDVLAKKIQALELDLIDLQNDMTEIESIGVEFAKVRPGEPKKWVEPVYPPAA